MDFSRATFADVRLPNGALEALTQNSLDGLAFIDARNCVVAWNDAAASLTGIEPESALGATLESLFLDAQKMLAQREARAYSVRLTPVDDHLRTIDAMWLPFEGGALISFGPQRRFRAIEHVKSEILASVSHELKTPIAIIKAYATTLRASANATEDVRNEYLSTIEEQADTLHQAVEELLLASKAQARDLPVERVTTPLAQILDGALEEIDAPQRGRNIERRDRTNVYGDPDLLREAFAQLIDNAIKFSSPPSPVSIDGYTDGSSSTVRIVDHGIGIAPEHRQYIFERFYRVEANLTASNAGTGLGLHIADAIVRAHGGSITVESALGRGSTFVVTLPVKT